MEADQAAPRARREAVEKAHYLLMVFTEGPAARDPSRKQLIVDVLADFDRLDTPDTKST